MIKNFNDTLRKIESYWQDIWYEKKIFEPEVGSDKKFFFTVAYPYTNAPLHIGHARTYTAGDVIARFKRLQGYNVLWPMAWHVTGTPVLSIASKIAKADQETIDLFRDYISIYETDNNVIEKILSTFTNPEYIASFFAKEMANDFHKMGFSIDMSRQFTTGDKEYNRFVEWQFHKLYQKGFIVQDEYPILYCTRDKNAVGEDDISGGDEEKHEVTEMTLVKYDYKSEFYLITTTLRPETIFGVTNIWINESIKYNKIRVNEEVWVVSKQATEKLSLQGIDVEIIDEVDPIELIREEVKHPLQDRYLPILPAKFVDPDYGSGLVHSVPAHALYDYLALREVQTMSSEYNYNLDTVELISVINVDGYGPFPAKEFSDQNGLHDLSNMDLIEDLTKQLYSTEYYKGKMNNFNLYIADMSPEEAKSTISNLLKKEYKHNVFYEVSKPTTCRCGGKVVIAVLPDQYFLDYGNPEWKLQASKALDNMIITPLKYRSLFEKTFEWLDKRPCARRRGIGTKFPFSDNDWIIESLSDSTIYMALYTIIKQIRNNDIDVSQLIPEFFDFVFLNNGGVEELSKKIKVPVKLLNSIQMEFQYWYPNDMRHTAINHVSNHLSFAIYHHATIFPERYWPQGFSINEMLLRDGEKMSKSRGNVIPMADIPDEYSVDLIRLFLTSAASADTTINFKESAINEKKGQLKFFWNLINEVLEDKSQILEYTLEGEYFIVSSFALIRDAVKSMNNWNIREYSNILFYEMINHIRKFKSFETKDYCFAIKEILDLWIQYLSPVIPHICEEIWSKMEKEGLISMSTVPMIETYYYLSNEKDELILKQYNYINQLMDDISNIMNVKNMEAEKIYVYLSPKWKYEIFRKIKKETSKTGIQLNYWMREFAKNPQYRPHMQEIKKELQFLTKNFGTLKQLPKSFEFEKEAISKYREIIEEQFNCEIIIQVVHTATLVDPFGKAKSSRPMRPAIYIERR